MQWRRNRQRSGKAAKCSLLCSSSRRYASNQHRLAAWIPELRSRRRRSAVARPPSQVRWRRRLTWTRPSLPRRQASR